MECDFNQLNLTEMNADSLQLCTYRRSIVIIILSHTLHIERIQHHHYYGPINRRRCPLHNNMLVYNHAKIINDQQQNEWHG